MSDDNCLFCSIVSEVTKAVVVYEDKDSLVFLDHRPLFPGHCLVVPRVHSETLLDLPQDAVGPFFLRVQLIARAVEAAMKAEGSFVAMNNRVSQSVPHLHVHVVPRKRKDGLKGFFWPRTKYESTEEMIEVGESISEQLAKLVGELG
ncbi:MAG TPA: HIT family protein [Pyrinomonadaceae bacterium]